MSLGSVVTRLLTAPVRPTTDPWLKVSTVQSHAMHDHGHLSSHRDGRLFDAGTLHDPQSPGPKRARSSAPTQQRPSCIVERLADCAIAAFRDGAGVVSLTRLDAP